MTEDSAVYRQLLFSQLTEWGYSVTAVPDAESALPVISTIEASIVLLIDWELPGMSGIDLLSQVRQLTRKHYAYVILLTARDNKADLVAALSAGADDYLAKPFNRDELRARLQVAVRTLGLHEQLVNANERLEELAGHDPLTDLLNRRALMTALHRERLRGQRQQSPVTLVMCDIDHFKAINDSHGHLVGDEVIKVIARSLQESARGSDFVARLGGDEFLMVLPGSDTAGGERFVDRVRKSLEERKGVRKVAVSLSFGIAAMRNDGTEEEAIARVDGALYSAKRKGRNRHSVAD